MVFSYILKIISYYYFITSEVKWNKRSQIAKVHLDAREE